LVAALIRDIWVGLTRFDEIQRDLGISRKVLAERLKWLVAHGVLEQHAYSERPLRHEYRPTQKGFELADVLLAITAWGDRWAAGDAGPPALLRHRSCGELTHAELRCARCGRAAPRQRRRRRVRARRKARPTSRDESAAGTRHARHPLTGLPRAAAAASW
jgi:DNA-binding HxlR family transcriptional regulator